MIIGLLVLILAAFLFGFIALKLTFKIGLLINTGVLVCLIIFENVFYQDNLVLMIILMTFTVLLAVASELLWSDLPFLKNDN